MAAQDHAMAYAPAIFLLAVNRPFTSTLQCAAKGVLPKRKGMSARLRNDMDIAERLAKERRARLAAERLLDQKQRELFAANEKLAMHARSLSDQIVEQRQVVKSALSEAEVLKGQNSRFMSDLDRAHTAAVMAERRLWDSVNTIRDGFAVFDSNMKLIAANRAYLAAFDGHNVGPGISYEEILRLTGETGLISIGERTVDAWVTEMLARWDQDPVEPMVVQFSNGNWVKLVDRRARDGGMVTLALNITEQMRIWAALEAIPDGFVLFDRDDKLLTCNQRYREIYPQTAPAMLRGNTFEEILRFGLKHGQYGDLGDREEVWIEERLARYREASGISEQQLGDGRWLRILEQKTPDGGRVGLRVDITEMKEQQAALDVARLAAESANRAKSAFLANMSHEIRTPMNGVVGMAELLCDTALSDEQRLFAETIRSSGEALLVIINDVLDYSKIEAQRMTLHPEPFDLERVIHEVMMLLQPRAHAKGIDLLIDFDMFLPTRFVGDPGRLRQVLTNLIGNAVKFTDKGHVLTRVVGVETEPGSQQLHVTIEDTGIGIAAEHLGHIFGEFNQVEEEANRKFEGTGLGLAITQRLIEHMDGAVWVESEPGKGSCFGFRLPLPVAEDTSEAPSLPITLRRALVVDDQFINRTILDRQLTAQGIEVVLCRSGADALDTLARDAVFDVLLTDHDMPEMDGMALARAVRAKGYEMPIVLLSSCPTQAREGSGDADLAAILQKPLLRSDLYRRLRALSAPAGSESSALPLAVKAAKRRKMRILAAEDNRTNQMVFRKMVQHLEIDLTFAGNGRETVDLFRSLSPDLIFMDISMPEMDGRDAARAIRALEGGSSHVPIVALTAHAMEGDADDILASGIDEYLTKPLRKSAIIQTIVSHCAADLQPVERTGPV